MIFNIHLIDFNYKVWRHLLGGCFLLLYMISPFQGMAQTLSQTLRINEFLALNQTSLLDEDSESSDWIEIYNPTSDPIDLNGWSLTDDKTNLQKWQFPHHSLAANGYLVLFASGKDRHTAGQELHTNFKLSGNGEYFALVNPQGTIATEFDPAFPQQYADVSYGFYDNDYVAFTKPTPGAANQYSENQLLPSPVFNKERGFYESAFNVEITTDLQNAQIYYTTDGSDPGEENGQQYSAPIPITTTTVLRAIVVKSGDMTSRITTHTYIFLDDVINQPNDPPGYPAEWGPYTAMSGNAIADYEMDPEVTQDSDYKDFMKDALQQIPTMSLVSDKDNFFSFSEDPETGGIYIYTGPPLTNSINGLGDGWERPVSVEYFNSDGSEGFHVDCGVRLQGGHSRRPEKSPKHSFRLVFKSKYGPSKFEYPLFGDDATSTFNTITLRAGFCNSWHHHESYQRNRSQLLRDTWAKDTQLEMGQLSGHGNFVHLYINGIYWGLYNPTERMDKEFATAYLGGDDSDFDVIKDYSEVIDGNDTAWKAMMNMANSGLSSTEAYQRIQGNNPDGTRNPAYEPYVDVVNLIDYMILNLYGGNTDWDYHNWAAIRNRVNPEKGFKFFSWDAEHILESVDHDMFGINNGNCPSGLFQNFRENADFRRLFADRVHFHFFNGGALTPESCIERYMKRAAEIDLAIIAESARWGDYRRDVHQYQTKGPFDLYTKNDYWLPAQLFIVNDYFPDRIQVFIQQAQSANLYPTVNAPVFYINGEQTTDNIIEAGDVLTMTSTNGTIYYTTDGTDPSPSSTSGNISANAIAYAEPLILNKSTYMKARTLNGNSWSALNVMLYKILSDIQHLKITEIHYHPLPDGPVDDSEFEFVELKNTGEAPLDLDGVQFIDGISYQFSNQTILNAGKFVVLASNRVEFKNRYNMECFAEFDGNLNNGGERLAMIDAGDDTLFSVHYLDDNGWPESADGQGYSLVPVDFNPGGDQSDPANWRASFHIHGSPGEDDTESSGTDNPNTGRVATFELKQNYPNPFNPTTLISYQIPNAAFVKLTIYDILGRKINTLVNEFQNSNLYSKEFDANGLPSGVYFYRLKAGDHVVLTKKMLLIR